MSKRTSKVIPYSRQYVDESDIQAVTTVLKSDWLTQGPTTRAFEEKIADLCGAKYAVAVSSATAALHLACIALEPKSLWTSPNTFVASANCGRYCGAEVDFVDIDYTTLNISVSELESKLKSQKAPDVLVPVHFAGRPAEMEQIFELSKEHGFKVIEDASHALGAEICGEKIGSCRYSDITVFSFHPVKGVTTGEGGVLLTNSEETYNKVVSLRSHGVQRPEGQDPWFYEQCTLGFNYRISDIHSALGLSQLAKLDTFIKRKEELANTYEQELRELPIITPELECSGRNAWHLYPIKLKLEEISLSKLELFNSLLEKGVRCQVHYIPVHTQPYYQDLGFKLGDFPVSEQYYKEALSLPLFYSLSDEEHGYVISLLKELLS